MPQLGAAVHGGLWSTPLTLRSPTTVRVTIDNSSF